MSDITIRLPVSGTARSSGAWESWFTALRFGRVHAVIARHLSAISLTFFVHSAWVGLAGLAVLASVRPQLALAGLLVSVLARLAAEGARAPQVLLDSGLIELNGWFLGLACTTFFAAGPGLIVALLLSGALAAVFTIVMHRVLATWDLPLLVAPYVPAYWLVSAMLFAFPWSHSATIALSASPASPAMLVLVGGLRGLGQIFFVPDARVGLGLAMAASLADRRLGVAMVLASVSSVGVGYLAGSPAWQVQQGLAGFSAALMAVAALRGFAGLSPAAVAVIVVASPFLESAALRLAGSIGLQALSTAFVGLAWTAVLLRPVREASAARTGWSTGKTPRQFENG